MRRDTYEQLEYTEKQANNVASVTSGLRSPTKMLKCPANKKDKIILSMPENHPNEFQGGERKQQT